MNYLLTLVVFSFYFCYVCSFEDDITSDDHDVWSSINDSPTLYDDDVTQANKPYLVALVAQTGAAGYLGQVVKAGFKKAVSDLKKMCFRKNCQVPSIVYFDTESSPEKALQFFKYSYRRGIRTFIGFVTSDEAKIVAEYALEYAPDAILVSPTSTATILCRYKNLFRMTMDDRGYAEVLFDVAVHYKKMYSPLPIQIIHRDDIHGIGLANDIKERFTRDSKEDYKVHSPIPYKIGNSFNHSNFVQQLLQSSLAREKYSLITLIGLISEAELILQEVARHSSLKNHIWILSDALTLSNIKIPSDMNVLGLNFVGAETSSNLLNKERNGLMRYLYNKNLPLMPQVKLAYDVITVLQRKAKTVLQYTSNTVVIEGLTGPLEFSRCRERTTGSYSLVVSPKKQEIDNVVRKVVMKEWMEILRFDVESNDRFKSQFSMLEDYSPDAMMEVELESTSKKGVSSVGSPTIEISKKEFLEQLAKIGNKTCYKNAQLGVQYHDEQSQRPVNVTYAIRHMPESVVFPVRYGFIMTATCRTEKNTSYQLTRVCPPTKVGGSEIICQTKVSSTAVGKVTSAAGPSCILHSIGTVTCFIGVAGCFVGSVFVAGLPAALCSAGAAGCGGLGVVTAFICRTKKYVCTELFRQGYLPPDIMLADMSFASHYSVDYPITRKGYDILGPAIASWMSSSEMVTNIAKSIVIPWAEEMAYHEGYRETGNDFGALVMSIGSIVCGLVGAAYIYSNYIIGGMILIAVGIVARIKSTYGLTAKSFAKKFN